MQQEGVLLSVFDVLRRVPRRVLMVLKLNDLTRSVCSIFMAYDQYKHIELDSGAWIMLWRLLTLP